MRPTHHEIIELQTVRGRHDEKSLLRQPLEQVSIRQMRRGANERAAQEVDDGARWHFGRRAEDKVALHLFPVAR